MIHKFDIANVHVVYEVLVPSKKLYIFKAIKSLVIVVMGLRILLDVVVFSYKTYKF